MERLNFLKTEFNLEEIISYLQWVSNNPIRIVVLLIDLAIVLFLVYKIIKVANTSRAWQLMKGIAFLIVVTILSSILNLKILNYILSAIMSWGIFALIVIFQPELRRALEQLGTNKITKFFGMDKDIAVRTKEDIYKVVSATSELAKNKTGALIVMERDIKINDIVSTGIVLDSEISPQLLVNIFVPKSPLHDGAVVISKNKIHAAACLLPLASDQDIAKELGTRHRAAIGISKESDSIAIVVSEETGKISVAKNGTLIADVKEEVLKKILINNLISKNSMNEENGVDVSDIKIKKIFNKNKVKKQEDKNLKQ